MGKLNDQVKNLEDEGGIEIGGIPKRLLCFKSWDWKVMMLGSWANVGIATSNMRGL